MNDFYVTLMSNTHGGDKTGDFSVSLPSTLTLNGKYECALTDIIFPYTFDNVTFHVEKDEPGEKRIDVFLENLFIMEFAPTPTQKVGLFKKGKVSAGLYTNAEVLVEEINKQCMSIITAWNRDVPWSHFISMDPISRRCSLNFPKEVLSFHLSRKLAYMLGLEKTVGPKLPHGKHPVHTSSDLMFVYADCCEFQILSNVTAPLLAVLAVKGNVGANIEHTVARPHYVPVRSREIGSIRIQLKNDQNEIIAFHSGKVCVVLHFRRSPYF